MSLVTKCLEMGLNLTVEELVSLSLDALMKEICKQKQTDVIPESVWIQIKDLRRLYLNRVAAKQSKLRKVMKRNRLRNDLAELRSRIRAESALNKYLALELYKWEDKVNEVAARIMEEIGLCEHLSFGYFEGGDNDADNVIIQYDQHCYCVPQEKCFNFQDCVILEKI